MKVIVKSDGSEKPIGDGHYHGAYGFVVREDGWKVYEENGYLHSAGSGSGLFPELQAAIKALKYIRNENYGIEDEVVFKTDNPSVYDQLADNPVLRHVAPKTYVEKVRREGVSEAHYAASEIWDKRIDEINNVVQEPGSFGDFFESANTMEVS